MAKYITDQANNPYDFGQDFNYAVWTENTVVTLTNVPWNNDYRDVCNFPSDIGQSLDQYIDSHETANISIPNVSYIKFNVPIRVNIPFNKAFRFNYLRVQNPAQPIPGSDLLKSYYYFILDVKYIAPNATEITIQLDIFQSFRNDFTLGNCYIERGHIGIANQNSFDNYGRDYLTIPEGLDIGGEYVQIAHRTDEIMDTATADILMVTTVSITATTGDVNNPILITARGDQVQGIPSGANYYVFENTTDLKAFLASFSDKPWITQGIISLTMIPDLSRYGFSKNTIFIPSDSSITVKHIGYKGSHIGGGKYTDMFPDWRNSSIIRNAINPRYANLLKFFTYPYMVIEATTWGATPIIIKPESWNDGNARMTEKIALTPPNQKVVIYPNRYNAVNNSDIETVVTPAGDGDTTGTEPAHTDYYDDGGDYLDMATQISNFPALAIVNNMAIGYMASNAHGIAFQTTSADWTQQRALNSNQTSYDQTNKGIQASKNINALQNAGIGAQAANQNLLIANNLLATSTGSMISGVAGIDSKSGAAALGAGINAVTGLVVNSITSGNQQDTNTQAANITQQVSKGSNTGQNNQNTYVNDTNKTLADWSARGDYANTIGAINAKVQDIKLTQPSTSGQVGGEAFNLIHKAAEISLRWKLISNAEIRSVGEYWLRYGYAIRQFGRVPNNFMVMSKFTYWKLLETYIVSSSMPEGFKQIIRGIFEKGVTVWANPDYIGNIDLADNDPIEGVIL